jgi:hypothetical protein
VSYVVERKRVLPRLVATNLKALTYFRDLVQIGTLGELCPSSGLPLYTLTFYGSEEYGLLRLLLDGNIVLLKTADGFADLFEEPLMGELNIVTSEDRWIAGYGCENSYYKFIPELRQISIYLAFHGANYHHCGEELEGLLYYLD